MNIPLFKIYWDQDDIDAVTKVMERGSYWATGPEIKEFEEKIADYVGTKYAVVFNSGTSALHAILLALGIQEGDEVIVPSFTFISTANAPLFIDAKPVFADIEENTYGLDADDVKKRISDKTRAIIPIHYGGCPCKHIKEIKDIADDKDLLLIEDAAESLGARAGNKNVGTFGDSAMFSFCQNKIITTGEGGAIATNDEDISRKLRLLVSHGRSDNDSYFTSTQAVDYITLGYNFRMPTMCGALGISQMKKVAKNIAKRNEIARMYDAAFETLPSMRIPVRPDGFESVYQMYTIRVESGKRDALQEHLSHNGISTKVFFDPVHLSRFYREVLGHREGELPVTESVSDSILSLPIFPNLTQEEVEHIIHHVERFFGDIV